MSPSNGTRGAPGSGPSSDAKRTIRAFRLLFAAAILVPAILFVAAAWQDRQVLFEQAEQRTVKTAAILQQQVSATLQIYDMIFLQVGDYLRTVHLDPDPGELHARLKRLNDEVGQVYAIFVLDRAGNVVAHSRAPPPLSITASDRDYFTGLRDKGMTTSIGEPIIGRLSGERRLNMARRLDDDAGRFAGAVVVSVSEAYVSAFHRAAQESPNDVMSLIRADGVILARSPMTETTTRSYSSPRLLAAIETSNHGSYYAPSVVDGIERIFAYRQIGNFPLYVAFGLATDGILRSWYSNLVVYGAIAAPAVLLLLIAAWAALQRARQEEAVAMRLRSEINQRAAAETRREEAESALRQAQKMKAVGQLTGGIAHDFNNLLMVIAGNIELVIRQVQDPAAIRRLEASLKATERGQRLTRQLLTFARQRPLHTESVNLRRHLAETAELVEHTIRHDIALAISLTPGIWDVEVDTEQLEVALLNIIVNARDAIGEEGEIRIEAANVMLPSPGEERGELNGEFVALSISDTGRGIAPDVLPRVFEPFFTTKSVGEGSGFGLAQVYGFAQQSKGAAHIESQPGHGTTVILYLPRAPTPAAEPGSAAEPIVLSVAAGRVLVVEDDPAVADVAVGALEQLGYRAVVVDRARHALTALTRGEQFDLVFSDVVMPEMSGIELADEMARSRPDMPVLLTTGYAGEQRDGAVSGHDIILKPYNLETLRKALDRCLDRHRRVAVKRASGAIT